nr:DUF882 domain-containing protein [Methylopila turkensis]
MVAGSESTQNAQANGDTRTLTLHHTHRGDTITVTFKRNGRYDADGLKKLSHFLRDWRNDKSTRMEPKLFDIVWEVHREVGRGQMINIVSSYRSPETNAMLRARSRGVAKFSQHMLGRAMDFYITGVPVSAVREAGMRLQRGGVGFYPTSGRPFVHLDAGSIRAWPRMSRTQLARLFPGGKTVHQPAEGGQMPGYQVALAELKSRGGVSVDDAYSGSSSSGSSGKSFFARLFGSDEGDETEVAPTVVASATSRAAASRSRPAAPAASEPGETAAPAAPAAPTVVAAARVPLPTPRPNDMPRVVAPEAPVVVASIPTPPAAPARAMTVASAQPAVAPTPPQPDMVWRSGAQPVGLRGSQPDAAEPAMALAATIPAPRPRPAQTDSAVAVLAAIPTPVAADRSAPAGAPRPREINPAAATAYQAEAATFPRLPDAFLARKQPAQPEMTLAYAAPQTSQIPVENRSRPSAPQAQHRIAPSVAMDGVRVISPDATPSAVYAAAIAQKKASLPAAPMVTARFDGPALRAMTAPARAVRAADDGTLKHPDSSGHVELLASPSAVLAGGFGHDPSHGAQIERFAGSSVTFLRTLSFAPAPTSTAAAGAAQRG